MKESLETECKSHVELFHQYFFNLIPDNEYIEHTLNRAFCLADETAKKQYLALKEKGFYTELVTSSATMTIICDSIQLDTDNMSFTYYGTQRINRLTTSTLRTIVTTGTIENTNIRSQNNPHGMIIRSWKTLQNKQLYTKNNKII